MTPDEQRRARVVHLRFAVASVLALAAFALTDGLGRGLTLTAVSAAVAVLVMVRLVRRRLPRPVVWWCVVVGLGLLSVNNLGWLLEVDVGGATEPSHPVVLLSVPLGYLGMLVAAVLLVVPTARRDIGGVLDAMTIAVGGSVVLWTLLLFPALSEAGATPGRRAYELAVLLILSGIIGALVQAAVATPRARPSLVYFLVSVGLTLAGNVLRTVATDPATGVAPVWTGSVWVLAYLAAAAAAGHPSAAHVDDPAAQWAGRLSPRRILLLGVALGAGPALAAIRALLGAEPDWLLVSLSLLLLVPLAFARVAQLARLHADAELRLEHLAQHDPLTGLPNRRVVDERLAELLARVQARESPGAAVMFLDLNDFKDINDTHGHGVGDTVLETVAGRLQAEFPADDGALVARLGGDEFVVVLEGAPEALHGEGPARVERALAEPFDVAGTAVRMSASVGTAVVRPGEEPTVRTTLSLADTLMYGSKRTRRATDV